MNKIQIKSIFLALLMVLFFSFSGSSYIHAQTKTGLNSTPSTSSSTTGPVDSSIEKYLCTPTSTNGVIDCIQKGYKFILTISIAASVLLLVFAGYLYITGTEQSVTQAKSVISTTVAGLAILLLTYAILRQINPSIVEFKPLSPFNIQNEANVNLIQNPTNGTTGGGPIQTGSSQTCDVHGLEKQGTGTCSANGIASCPDCVKINGASKQAAASLANFINNTLIPAFDKAGVKYNFNDGMCPTHAHSSCAHFNGHAIDIGYGGDKANGVKMCQVLNSLGVSPQDHMNSGDRNAYIVEDSGLGAPCPPRVNAGTGLHLQM